MPKRKTNDQTYEIPKEIYKKARREIKHRSKTKQLVTRGVIKQELYCHRTEYKKIHVAHTPNSSLSIMEAMKEAFEDRNFKTLYELISKALDMRNKGQDQQAFEYMFYAISHDPVIDRASALDRYLSLVKKCETLNEKEEFLYQQTTFRTPKEDSDESGTPEASHQNTNLKSVENYSDDHK